MRKLLFITIFLASCQVNYDDLKTQLVGTWTSNKEVPSLAGTQTCVFTANFQPNGHVVFTVQSPLTGTTTSETYLYEVGYLEPKMAISFFDPNLPHGITNSPMYFYFENNARTFISSTNADMSLSQKWNK